MPLKYCLCEPNPVTLSHNIFIAVLIENICIQYNPSTLELSTGSVQGYPYGQREDRTKVDSLDSISESPNTLPHFTFAHTLSEKVFLLPSDLFIFY